MISSIRFFSIVAIASISYALNASEHVPCTGMTHAMIGKELMAWYNTCLMKKKYPKEICEKTFSAMLREHEQGKLTKPECLPSNFAKALVEQPYPFSYYGTRVW